MHRAHLRVSVLLLIAATLAACTIPIPPPPPPTATPQAAAVAAATETAAPTATPAEVAVSATPTEAVPATEAATATAVPTEAVAATATTEPQPTTTAQTPAGATSARTPEQKVQFVQDMLANNGGCSLPCWWGIQPGQPLEPAAIEAISSTLYHTSSDQGIDITINTSNLDALPEFPYRLNIGLGVANGGVTQIAVHTESTNPAAVNALAVDWPTYAPNAVLTRFGMPTDVQLATWFTPGQTALNYALMLVYADKGLAVRYTGVDPASNGAYALCPTFSTVKGMDLLLAPPSDNASFAARLNRWQAGEAQNMLPIQSALGMSMADFVRKFSADAPGACINPMLTKGARLARD